MPAFASIELPEVPLSRESVIVGVYRYDPSAYPKYQLLPNVRVMAIRLREGPDPGLARFRYVFDPVEPATDPSSFQQALAVDCGLANVVKNDERLVVLRTEPDGTSTPIFDGFAQVPELTLSPARELVTFVAYGVAVREWDTPIAGAVMRDADDPTGGRGVETDLDARFNPRGEPNATPEDADTLDLNGNAYPIFLDSLVVRTPDVRRRWTLPMAVRYLTQRHNPTQFYVKNPSGELIDALLDSRSPGTGVSVNPGDPAAYESQPIVVPDYIATGKPWPVAVHELISPHGFGMVFRLEVDSNGDPVTRLELFRRQDASVSSYKDLYLQASGEPLDPSRTNLSQASLARDTSRVANVYVVTSSTIRYEASFVLAPGFPIAASDASTSLALKAFDRAHPFSATTHRDKYRLYIFDETGEGHWNFATADMDHGCASLESLFGPDEEDDPPTTVKRRRVPSGELFTLDGNRKPLRARLAISTDYAGSSPGLWDGTGTWQSVVGGWELLRDRLGIWINVPNPNGWVIGPATVPGMPYPAGVVKGVEDQALLGGRPFKLRLTCVIEGDRTLRAIAGQRPSSSTSFAITRRVDARNRYAIQIVAGRSEFNPGRDARVVRDDTAEAEAEAHALRLRGEAGEVAGSATIPRFTTAYRIGDKIRSIRGRDLSLRTNAGAPMEEGEVFPSVVGLTWDFEGKQNTILQLSDHRGERS